MRGADLRESDLLGKFLCLRFMACVTVSMHKDNGNASQTCIECILQLCMQTIYVQGLHQLTMRTHTLLGFNHPRI